MSLSERLRSKVSELMMTTPLTALSRVRDRISFCSAHTPASTVATTAATTTSSTRHEVRARGSESRRGITAGCSAVTSPT
jgi:hypothetical protein